MEPITLTVAIVVADDRCRLRECFAALERGRTDGLELVIVDITAEGRRLPPIAGIPVRRAHLPNLRPFAAGRAECAGMASGEYIAFLEDHVVPGPGWAAAVIRAFEQGADAVNYALTNLNPESYVSRASFLTDYAPWTPPVRSGPIRNATCNNIAYRKKFLDRFGGELQQYLHSEYLVHRAILETGGTMAMEAGAVVAHENRTRLSQAMFANRSFRFAMASARARFGGWSDARCAAYAAGMVLVPPLMLLRLGREVWNRPSLWLRFVEAAPVAFAVYAYGAWYESKGYLAGRKRSGAPL